MRFGAIAAVGAAADRLAVAVAAALALLIALGLMPVARADYYPPQCGGDHVIRPAHHPPHERPPLAIGDSTMLLAAYDLAAAGYEVDAQGCRQYDEALKILATRHARGTLPHMVLLALGADGRSPTAMSGERSGCCAARGCWCSSRHGSSAEGPARTLLSCARRRPSTHGGS